MLVGESKGDFSFMTSFQCSPPPSNSLFMTGPWYVTQAGLEFTILSVTILPLDAGITTMPSLSGFLNPASTRGGAWAEYSAEWWWSFKFPPNQFLKRYLNVLLFKARLASDSTWSDGICYDN